MGREEKFQYYADIEEDARNLFTQKEARSMRQFKSLLDDSVLFLAAVFLITGMAYWLLMRYNKAWVIRNRFLWSLVFYAGFWISLLIVLLMKPDVILMNTGGLVDQLIGTRFIRDWYLACFFVSTVIIGIIASISWRITRPRRLFS